MQVISLELFFSQIVNFENSVGKNYAVTPNDKDYQIMMKKSQYKRKLIDFIEKTYDINSLLSLLKQSYEFILGNFFENEEDYNKISLIGYILMKNENGEKINNLIKIVFKNYFQKLEVLPFKDIIKNILKFWNDLMFLFKTLRNVSLFYDIEYCEKNQENVENDTELVKDYLTIKQEGILNFKNIFLQKNKDSIIRILSKELLDLRYGNPIDEINVKALIKIIYDVSDYMFYNEYFEKNILHKIAYFYNEKVNYIKSKELSNELITEIQNLINREELYIDKFNYKNPNEQNKFHCFQTLAIDILIKNNINQYKSYIILLFDSNQFENLNLVYKLFNSTQILDIFLQISLEIVLNKINFIFMNEENNYIEKLLELYSNLLEFNIVVIENNKNIFTKIINLIIEKINSNSDFNKIINNYINNILSKNLLNEININNLFFFINNIKTRDEFESYYKNWLIKRIINNNYSEDNEIIFIKEFKLNYLIFSNTIEDILKNNDKELNDEFKQINNIPINFNIKIFKNNIIRNENNLENNIILPEELKLISTSFNSFYEFKFNKRKLLWQYNMSKNEVSFNINKKYTLILNTFQTIILYLFNNNDSLTFEKIKKLTNLKDIIIKNILSIFVKKNLLIENNENYSVNNNFKSSSKVIKFINYTTKTNKKIKMNEEDELLQKDLIIQRSNIIDATIVRIMKKNRKINHNDLISEILEQSINFKPEINLLKSRIESLIERDYMTRIDQNIYEYIS